MSERGFWLVHILMVCTGNMCRSPLAEVMLAAEIEKRGVRGTTVASAGTGAWDGNRASEGAVLVALEHGLDLSEHRARHLNRDLVAEADIIFVMERSHAVRVERLGGGDRVHVLGEYAGRRKRKSEVPDPYGAPIDEYRKTYDQLNRLIPAAADKLGLEEDA